MRKLSFSIVSLAAVLTLALTGSADHKPGHAKGGGEKGGRVSLVGVFQDEPGDAFTPTDRVMSDCMGGPACPYTDGEPGIDLDLRTGIRLDVNSDGQLGTRGIKVNFSDCVAGPCTPPFVERIVGDRSGPLQGGLFAALTVFHADEVGVGEALSRNARLAIWTVEDPNDGEVENWFIEFRDFADNPDHPCHEAGSGPLVVSHPDGDTWVVETSTTNLACLHSQASKPHGDGTRELHGTYEMPFKLTLTRRP